METLSTLCLPDPPATDDNAVLCRHWWGVMVGHYHAAVEAAARIGDVLCEQKQLCGHGRFKAWIDENCPFSYRTAADYMKLARNPDLVEEYKSAVGDGSSIKGALEYIKPKVQPTALLGDDEPPEVEYVTGCSVPDSAIVATWQSDPETGEMIDGTYQGPAEAKPVRKAKLTAWGLIPDLRMAVEKVREKYPEHLHAHLPELLRDIADEIETNGY